MHHLLGVLSSLTSLSIVHAFPYTKAKLKNSLAKMVKISVLFLKPLYLQSKPLVIFIEMLSLVNFFILAVFMPTAFNILKTVTYNIPIVLSRLILC